MHDICHYKVPLKFILNFNIKLSMIFVFPTRVIFGMQNISKYVSSTLHISLVMPSLSVEHKVEAPQPQGQTQGPALSSQPDVAAVLLAVVAALDHGAVPGHLGLTPRPSLNLGLQHDQSEKLENEEKCQMSNIR